MGSSFHAKSSVTVTPETSSGDFAAEDEAQDNPELAQELRDEEISGTTK